jgi:hypothetical protein
MPSSKAVASEEARRYHPHFVWPFARRMDLGEREIPSSVSELLSDARTPLADFFSILLAPFGVIARRTKSACIAKGHVHSGIVGHT